MEQIILILITGIIIGFLIHKIFFSKKNNNSPELINNLQKEINEYKTKLEVKENELEITKKHYLEQLSFKSEMLDNVSKSITEVTQKEQKPYIVEMAKEAQRLNTATQNIEKQKEKVEMKERELSQMHAQYLIKREYNASVRGLDSQQVMERVIKSSGYVPGKHVIFDKKIDGIKGRPDATLIYPKERKICCDSKAPLAKFDQLVDAGRQGNDEKIKSLKVEFGKAVIDHINWLSSKEYQKAKNSEDFILMFLPSSEHEHMARECVQLWQKDLDRYAQDKNIYVVSPNTFTPYIQTAYSIWQLHENAESAEETLNIVKNAFNAAKILQEKIVRTKSKIGSAYEEAEGLEKSYNSTFKNATKKVEEAGYSDENVVTIKKHIEKREDN